MENITDLIREGWRIYPLDGTIFYRKIGNKPVVSLKYNRLKVLAFQKLNIVAVREIYAQK